MLREGQHAQVSQIGRGKACEEMEGRTVTGRLRRRIDFEVQDQQRAAAKCLALPKTRTLYFEFRANDVWICLPPYKIWVFDDPFIMMIITDWMRI